MGQGLSLAQKSTFALSTTESANQVTATYDYIGPGKLMLYALPSDATVRCNLFVNGVQILRNSPIGWFGTTGAMDTSANLITAVNTMGGKN